VTLLLGLDVGTTAIKVLLFDAAAGRSVAIGQVATVIQYPGEGRSEFDPAGLWSGVAAAIRQALEDVLLRSRVELFGSLGARLELELLLMLGRAEEARGMLTDGDMKANKRKLTTFIVPRINSADPTPAYIFPAYEWLLTCQAAASGDYDPADAALEEIGERLNAEVGRGRLESQLLMTSEIGALAQRSQFTSPLFLKENLEMQSRRVLLQVEQADVLALRGLLDLERGAPTDGERRLAESLSLSRSAMLAGAGCPSRPLVLAYLKRVRAGRD